jgi:hypothetical protein
MPLVKAEGEPRLWDWKGLSINCMSDFFYMVSKAETLALGIEKETENKMRVESILMHSIGVTHKISKL